MLRDTSRVRPRPTIARSPSFAAGDDAAGTEPATAEAGAHPGVGRWAVSALLGSAALVAAWNCRFAIVTAVGRLLVSEDSLQPVQVIVISHANAIEDALEAARLYAEGYGTEVVVPAWEEPPLDLAIRGLGIPYFGEGMAAEILKRSGVPSTAVHVLRETADGTQTEIAAVGAFVTERPPASLLFVTMRTHTARARWLLRDALPAATRLLVRAPRTDRFSADSWWRSREESREVFMEYLRWFNTFILHDPWGSGTEAPSRASVELSR